MYNDGLLTYDRVEQPGGGYAGMAALFEGLLTETNGCLGLDGAPYIFPSDATTWDGTTLTVNSHSFAVGDTVTVGGGELSGERLSPDIAADCGDSTPVLVTGAATP
jgi:hypothetical protein